MRARKHWALAVACAFVRAGALQAQVGVDVSDGPEIAPSLPTSGPALTDMPGPSAAGPTAPSLGAHPVIFSHVPAPVGLQPVVDRQPLDRAVITGAHPVTVTEQAQALRPLAGRPEGLGTARLQEQPHLGSLGLASDRAGRNLADMERVVRGPQGSFFSSLGSEYDNAQAIERFLGVEGKDQSFAAHVAQSISIANRAPISDAPKLYLAVIEYARKFQPSQAPKVEALVRHYAEHRAQAEEQLNGFIYSAYKAAIDPTSAEELKHYLEAMDEFQGLLGHALLPGNESALKEDLLRVQKQPPSSIPHVYARRNAEGVLYAEGLPGGDVERVEFAKISPSVSLPADLESGSAEPPPGAPEDTQPNAGYVAAAMKAGSLAAVQAVARAAREKIWASENTAAYPIDKPAGEEQLSADVAHADRAADEIQSAVNGLNQPSLRVEDGSKVIDHLGAAAGDIQAMTGNRDAADAVDHLRGALNGQTQGLSSQSPLPPAADRVLHGPGGAGDVAARLSAEHERVLYRRVQPSLSNAGFKRLGRDGGGARAAQIAAAQGAGKLSIQTFEDHVWANGEGPYGRVEITAVVRSSRRGGRMILEVHGRSEALIRRLELLGLTVSLPPGKLRAELDARDFVRDEREIAAITGLAMAYASGSAADPARYTAEQIFEHKSRDLADQANPAIYESAPPIFITDDHVVVLGPVSVSPAGKLLRSYGLLNRSNNALEYVSSLPFFPSPVAVAAR